MIPTVWSNLHTTVNTIDELDLYLTLAIIEANLHVIGISMAMTKPVVDYLMGWAGRRCKAIDLANNAGSSPQASS